MTSSENPSTFAVPVTFSVTVAPVAADGAMPTGSVTATAFGSNTLGSGSLGASGHVSFTVPQTVAATAALPSGLANIEYPPVCHGRESQLSRQWKLLKTLPYPGQFHGRVSTSPIRGLSFPFPTVAPF
jgi:hypothetical protein